VAEDNPVNQKVADRILARLGHRADLVANGLEVLAALERFDYDVVFMDMQMPEMDGLEATRRIRAAIPPGRQPRIVAMTANVLQVDRDRCLAAGMDDFVSKPVRVEEMRAALSRNLPAAAPAPEREAGALGAAPVLPALPAASLDVVTREGLLAVSDGDPTVLAEITGLFTTDGRALITALLEAIARGDAPECARLAHSLKGSSANVGAQRVASLCAALEKTAKAGTLDSAQAIPTQIEVEFEAAVAALGAAVQHAAAPTGVSVSPPAP
jgi:CheY-like chemotaxis protein